MNKLKKVFCLIIAVLTFNITTVQANTEYQNVVLKNADLNNVKVINENGQDITYDFINDYTKSDRSSESENLLIKDYKVAGIYQLLSTSTENDITRVANSKILKNNYYVNYYANSKRVAGVYYTVSVKYYLNANNTISSVNSSLSYTNVKISYISNARYGFKGTGTAVKSGSKSIRYTDSSSIMSGGTTIATLKYTASTINV